MANLRMFPGSGQGAHWSLITSSEKAHSPSFYLSLLFPSLIAPIWIYIHLHFCSIMYAARLQDCYGEVSVEPLHP